MGSLPTFAALANEISVKPEGERRHCGQSCRKGKSHRAHKLSSLTDERHLGGSVRQEGFQGVEMIMVGLLTAMLNDAAA